MSNQHQTTKSNLSSSTLITVSVIIFALIPFTVNATTSSYASSNIGITKLASLDVKSLDSAELVKNETSNSLSTTTCMQARGESVPYRVSASSLASSRGGASEFAIGHSRGDENISYTVFWSDGQEHHQLSNANDLSEVIQVGTSQGCKHKTLSVQFNDSEYQSGKAGTYTDTLSLMFVIE